MAVGLGGLGFRGLRFKGFRGLGLCSRIRIHSLRSRIQGLEHRALGQKVSEHGVHDGGLRV